MRLRQVTVKNFRCLVDVTVPISDTVVFIGENDSGKTSLLEAIKVALPRNIAARTSPFDEYDYHMCKIDDTPQTCDGITIELWFKEDKQNDWNDRLTQALDEIIATDPIEELGSIRLRLSCKYDEILKEFSPKWEFVGSDGQPFTGKGGNPSNIGKFLSYIRLFYLSALRDSDDEFAPRSQFWGQILRNLNISESQRKTLNEQINTINKDLLSADPRLDQVKISLDNIRRILALGVKAKTSIQPLSVKPWELMSKSQVVIRTHGTEVDIPLARHGQGIQNLAVLFLFQAYIDVMLRPTFHAETEAILALEEPEAHLHPQAIRALARNLGELTSQKLISTHSPYFIQEIPLTDIRLFRRNGASSKVHFIKRELTVIIPENDQLIDFCQRQPIKFSYNSSNTTLMVRGVINRVEYRKILTLYPGLPDVHQKIKRIYRDSQFYLSDDDLDDLYNFVKRSRGEIFYAHAWLLCEGPCEYALLHHFAQLKGTPLDEAGISIIDFQNNGSLRSFICLAKSFEIPWIMMCDNDEEGKKYVEQVHAFGFSEGEMKKLTYAIPEENADLELFLSKNGFADEYLEMFAEQNIAIIKQSSDHGYFEELAMQLRKSKTYYCNELINSLNRKQSDKSRVPEFISTVIDSAITMGK